jgi:ABC-type transport system involved in cytochrome bd biosynthesis fused ATPase/permease subunit
MLSKLFPALSIPPIPSKTNVRKFDETFIYKRGSFIEKFLNQVLTYEELRGCKYVESFLKDKEEDFKNTKKESEKVQKIAVLEKLSTLSGEVHLKINQNIDNYIKKSSDYLYNGDIIYKRIRKLFK